MKQIIFAILLFGLISASFYPYPFNYGLKVDDVQFEHKQIIYNNLTIADGVHEIYYGSDGYIDGIVIEDGLGLKQLAFKRENGTLEIQKRNYTIEWVKKASDDDKKLAITIEWTVNNALSLEVCKAENKGSYWAIHGLYNETYDWIIERSLFAHNPLFNGANWRYEGNEIWKIYKVG